MYENGSLPLDAIVYLIIWDGISWRKHNFFSIQEQSDYDNVNALEENLKKLNYSENMEISADEFEQIISSLKKIQPFDRYFSSDMSVRQEFPIEGDILKQWYSDYG